MKLYYGTLSPDRVNIHTLHTIVHYHIHYIRSHVMYVANNHTLHTLRQSYTYIISITYIHTSYTNANHTICQNHSQPFILTTHSSNIKQTQQ
ncbi:hypothetical protein E2986_13785 [Frieseomelitta varia]|uniref:Uncharacterized protein n=1 Tax=Frieseomelitta varia TaxID=561572 RepID=A0A833VKE9_9HYME|nr:hypothetical protein E2986_13785 [Frieseomelitta varia]